MKQRQASLRQLEYFVGVAKASNFRQAAQRLAISQPTLTSQIAALEESLETRLFERSRAGTLLTPAGRELLPLARAVLEDYQALIDLAGSAGREAEGLYRLGVGASVGPYLLPHVLPELHRRYPDLRLHVQEDSPAGLERGLNDGRYDLILTVLPLDSSAYKVRPLFNEPLLLAMASDHPLAHRQVLPAGDLYKQEILTLAEPQLRRQAETVCERHGALLLEEVAGDSLDALAQMVSMGLGLAFLPALFLRSGLAAANLEVKHLGDEAFVRTHVAAWRQRAASRHFFQKISYEIKAIALDHCGDALEDLKTED